MIYLDTNVVVALIRNAPAVVGETLAERLARGDRVCLSTVVVFELWWGVYKSQRRNENAAQVRRVLASPISVVPFGDADAVVAAEIRATLSAKGTPIGPYDLLIAAQALRHGATLITANTREFSRVPGLKLDDWTA